MTEPIFLQGICKDYLWGGNRLPEEFGKESDADKIAESWELACHKDGSSIPQYVCPLKIYCSTRTGRQYLLSYSYAARKLLFNR